MVKKYLFANIKSSNTILYYEVSSSTPDGLRRVEVADQSKISSTNDYFA